MLASMPVSIPVKGRFISVFSSKKRCLALRAAETQQAEPTAMPATYFYGGKAYTEEEWKKAKADGSLYLPVPPETYISRAASDDEVMGLGDIMAFAGPAPELINGRLAMLAFVSALAAELSSGESVLRQWAQEPTMVGLTMITFAVASIIPMLTTTKREAFAFFTPNAEMLNGRAAMIGFAALLVVEGVRGSALF